MFYKVKKLRGMLIPRSRNMAAKDLLTLLSLYVDICCNFFTEKIVISCKIGYTRIS